MTVFVDTGVFYAHHDEDAPRHSRAKEAMQTIATGRFGRPTTSDYVFDETVTLALARFADPAEATTAGNRILGRGAFPDVISLLFVGSEQFFDDFDGLVDRLDPATF
ncbi:VapC toxin family PIN domain ribonuclease [Halomicroarcula sp. GCM10025324]|uniref:hypothetical protein n=1 Tax=Haloarcula TaxID=2237 RepID=UPI0023E76D42|nr:hypothetical protein [Halomicroarcula sp. ZS-22-S1]